MRFDAVGNLVENSASAWNSQPENHTVMNAIQTVVKGYDKRYMVCEAPDASQAFAATTSCGSAFAFDLKDTMIKAAKGDATVLPTLRDYFKTAPAGMATFLANHDSFAGDRLWNQFGGDVAKYKLAAATNLLLPGTPFIYYGEEVGMGSGAGLTGDAALRAPMSWTSQSTGFTAGTAFRAVANNITSQNVAAQVGVAGSLHSFYKSLLALRNTWPSLSAGTYQFPSVSGSVLAFQRHASAEKSLVVINYGATSASVSLSNLPPSISATAGFGVGSALSSDAAGAASLTVPAQSVSIYKL
jgi:glycosidase